MDRTDRATMIFCALIEDKQNTDDGFGSAVRIAIDLAYDIEKAVLDEEQRRAQENAGGQYAKRNESP